MASCANRQFALGDQFLKSKNLFQKTKDVYLDTKKLKGQGGIWNV